MADVELVSNVVQSIVLKGGKKPALAVMITAAMEAIEEYNGTGAWKKKMVVAIVTECMQRTRVGDNDMDRALDALVISAVPAVIDVIVKASKGSLKINKKACVGCLSG